MDDLTKIEGYLLTMVATATNAPTFADMHTVSGQKPFINFEIMEGEPNFVDANAYADCQLNAQFFISGDSKDQVRTLIKTLKFIGEPLPTDWTGIQLIDIKPGAPDQPWEDTSAKGLFKGAINLIIDFRQSYL